MMAMEMQDMGTSTEQILVRVRTQYDITHEIRVPRGATVRSLRSKMVEMVEHGEQRRFRFIFHGRLLDDDSTLESCGLTDGCCVHCAISSVPTPAPAVPAAAPSQGARSSQPGQPHLVGPDGGSGSARVGAHAAAHAAAHDSEAGRRRGFGRLLELGYSQEEVDTLRLMFLPHLQDYDRRVPQLPGETEYDRVYRLEEAWMAEQGSGSEFALNTGISHFGRQQRAGHGDDSSGTDEDVRAPLPVRQEALLPMDDGVQRPRTGTLADFTLGMFLGTFLGVIMLIWLFEGSLTKQHRLGIVAGVSLHIVFNMFRSASSDTPSRTGGGARSGGDSRTPGPGLRPIVVDVRDGAVPVPGAARLLRRA